ncbi:polyamine-transporting ATPase 13A3-like [Corythoichthys intestinalis]|uniref:polyamine-transporting ATPase 13A3-like n=1 Tax=Corythoichthys intestinalis TaxID=161448 RepID=UPI0025A6091C|nr:polyamine-transporting ATPase 13A3-like [Corythoichthys intestinalis]XP_061794912.1 polyamine-transporting ATPase 13A3-like [Nerophis lumbriciformis]
MKRREKKMLNRGLEDEMEVWGYRWCVWKLILVGIGALCTGGLLLLVLYWLTSWGVKATCARSSLRKAQVVLLRTTDDFKLWFRARVRVMLAPGTTPFESVEPNSTNSLLNVDDRQRVKGDPCKEHCGNFRNAASAKVHYFTHHNIKYFWRERTQNFESYKGLGDTNASCGEIQTQHSSGLSKTLQAYRALFFGDNEIDVKIPPLPKLFVKEVLNPFYIFQLFSFILWSLEDYYLYSLSMFLLTVLVIGASLYSIRRNYVKLRKMVVVHSKVHVSVCRGNEDIEQVVSSKLVPGDILTVPANGMYMPCDAVLICGTCTVDESMLTGESVPLMKTSVPSTGEKAKHVYSTEDHKHHTLFCGSQVIQSRFRGDEPVKAVVVRTGFSTEKGQLVRSILYPKPTAFKLHRDAVHFMMCMGVVAAIGFVFAIISDVANEVPVTYIVFNCLNIITVVLCPILPVTLTVGLYEAQQRMKRMGIFCVSPLRINITGQLNLICFDKTGTLTEDSLDLWAIQKAENGMFSPPDTKVVTESLANTFFACMSTCHSLTTVEGKLCGDPLDLKVFTATGSILEEPTEKQNEIYMNISSLVRHPEQSSELGTVRQFPFSSALQRMSVVVQQLGQKHLDVYMKGAPETVANLCKAHTVPQNFTQTLESYTQKGFRVIALAHRQLESELSWPQVRSLSREQVETDADFLGLIILLNKIKEQTADVLLDLRRANIRTLMATGDNMLTAVSVARSCGMIRDHEKVIVADAVPPDDRYPASVTWRYSENPVPCGDRMPEIGFAGDGSQSTEDPGYHFALSGQAYAVINEHFPELVPKLLLRATVFARMTPDQKTQLVQSLQNMDYIVGMCGDGANDCGALKKAHSGISLSELEASVASPFTSSIPNISCVTAIIREGRAALVTSFCVFKFVALYSLIAFLAMIQLYAVFSNLGDYQFLILDLCSGILLPCTICLNPTCPKLSRSVPPTRLICAPVLFSILSQTFNCLLFQIVGVYLVQKQPWYETTDPNFCFRSETNNDDLFSFDVIESDDVYVRTFENTTLFYIIYFQCIAVAIAFIKGRPFREPTYKNWVFILSCVILGGAVLFIMLYPIQFIDDHLMISCVPYNWRLTLIIFIAAHALVAIVLENVIVDVLWNIIATKVRAMRSGKPRAVKPKQMVTDQKRCGFFSKAFCCKKRPLKIKYKSLALKLMEEADWPPAPSSTTYSSAPHLRTSVAL